MKVGEKASKQIWVKPTWAQLRSEGIRGCGELIIIGSSTCSRTGEWYQVRPEQLGFTIVVV